MVLVYFRQADRLVEFHQSSVNVVHQPQLNFRWRQPTTTLLRSGQVYMRVDDSAEEFTSIQALGRERLPALSCGLPSNLLNLLRDIFAPLGDDRDCLSLFSAHQPPNAFQQKPGRGPPHTTGRSVGTAHHGWVGAPNKLATFRFHDAVVDFIEPSVWRSRKHAASSP